jgi:hypothetical protein
MLQFHASENKVHQLRVAIEHEGYEIDDQGIARPLHFLQPFPPDRFPPASPLLSVF